MRILLVLGLLALSGVSCLAQDQNGYGQESTYSVVILEMKDPVSGCLNCDLVLENKVILLAQQSGSLDAQEKKIVIMQGTDSMNIEIWIPLIGHRNEDFGESIYVDSVSFSKGSFFIGFGGWKPEENTETVSFKDEKLVTVPSEKYSKQEIDDMLHRAYYKVSVKDKKVYMIEQ